MSAPQTRVLQLTSGKWAAQLRQGCCQWVMLDKSTADPYIPTLSYQDYHTCGTEAEARLVEQKYKEKHQS